MNKIEKGLAQPKEFIKMFKGTLLAVLTGVTVQGCHPVDTGAGTVPLTGPIIDTTQKANILPESGLVTEIIITEAAPQEPIITILGPSSEKKPTLTVEFDGSTTSPEQSTIIAELATKSIEQSLQTPPQSSMNNQVIDFPSLKPETVKEIIQSIEKNPVDDEIVEDGRTVQIYSTPLKNGTSLILAKETIQKNWDEDQSNVVFYDRGTQYVAYNTVQFAKRYIEGTMQELKFGNGKSSVIVRNAYITPDPSQVSVLLTSRHLDDSLDILTRNKVISLYQQNEETNPVTFQKVTNSGGHVLNTTSFLREWEWLLDQEQGNHVYGIGRQSDGRFKRESVGDPVEINPSDNMGIVL